ncbi:MAG: beta-glucosidase/6-phospho-beta-glucosidase/beta-galactosidase [Microbacterium sp.]|uniref:family 1 glycosylhydrolase n=1 Tax=Microbacterium sp. TaxID=51671 RepID=UPI00262E78BE|nr:family 1 glycosylhydrolase [Microbacterium sp.]MDF2563349.1 beta-glucosidase/6-phospho-beta-glucosidase/beta-galactosidase [Microbacterium sp.]
MTTTVKWYQDGTLHFGLGIEDTFVPQTRAGERALDEYELTEHYENWHGDLQLASDVGAQFIRWGIPWHRVNPAPGEWDWEWVDRVLGRFDELGIRPIIDLLHYGTPLWMQSEFAHPDFAQHFADYAVSCAERYGDRVTDYTPVNEPMIHARFSGDVAYWPPYLSGERGYNTIALALAEGFVRAQRGIAEVLGERATFVHVDATARFAGDVDGQHRALVALQRAQSFLVEDLVTGGVGERHAMLDSLRASGVTDDTLAWFASHAVKPDVMGVNYYPRHSTQLMEEGIVHAGGFVDPWPTQDDGVAGLEELLRTYARRYGAPVMLTETCVTASVEERIAWLDASVASVRGLREGGLDVVGYTWWPLFDMYEWTYRHAGTPRSESLLTMGLFDLVESAQGLLRRKNPVADRFRQVAADAAANAPIARTGAVR